MSPIRNTTLSLLLITIAAAPSEQALAEQDPTTMLSVEIVNQYRQLRTSCNDQKGDARKMCYYRLRIGLWDYKEARKYLASKGIRITEGAQVAKLN